jgi:GTP-binding nuclear protein Ran
LLNNGIEISILIGHHNSYIKTESPDLRLGQIDIVGRQMSTFKVILVGDGSTGKTAFTKRCLGCPFETKYVATLGVEVHPVRVRTNMGVVTLNFWDTAGQEKFGGLRDGYYRQGHGCFIFGQNNHDNWYRDVTRVCGYIPIVVVQSKNDLPNNDDSKTRRYAMRKGLVYNSISSMDETLVREALLALVRQLVPGVNEITQINPGLTEINPLTFQG